jgi:uncharacterized protein YfaS (alpha-2-macroglobulin family)
VSALRNRAFVIRLLALLAVVGAAAYLISCETPAGGISGTVRMAENGKPLADAHIYLNDAAGNDARQRTGGDDERPSSHRNATTDENGRFTFSRVPVGKYQLSAASDYHRCEAVALTVKEAITTPATLRLTRSETELEIAAHQNVWSPSEKVHLPVRGYVDAKKGEFDSLHIRVYKTRLSTLMAGKETAQALDILGRSYNDHASPLGKKLLQPAGVAPSDYPRLISDIDAPINDADAEGFFQNRLPIAANGPGLYLVEVKHGGKATSGWVLLTDTALVVKKAGTQILAFAVNMRMGTPVGGAEIRQYRNGVVFSRATTSADGLAALTIPAPARPANADETDPADQARLLTVAVRGDDEAVLNRQEWNESDQTDRYAVYAYTDRTVYRPGQSISYKGVVRGKGEGDAGYHVPANAPITIEVRDPTGDRVAQASKVTNRWGSFFGGFDLGKEAPTGVYSLITTVAGEKHTTDIAVASYRKPEYAVTVTPAQTHYSRGDTVKLTVSAQYYYGAPVAGATVQYDVYTDTDWASIEGSDYDPDDADDPERSTYYGQLRTNGTVTLDANGQATVTVPTARKRPVGGSKSNDPSEAETSPPEEQILTCHATVTDDAKRIVEADGTAHVSAGDFVLNLSPDGFFAAPGKPMAVLITARDHDGKPAANVAVTLAATYQRWDAKNNTVQVSNAGIHQGATTGSGGTAALTFTPAHTGELELVATAYDSRGRVLHARQSLYASNANGGDLQTEYSDLSLLTDHKKYGPGDVARVLVNTAHLGQTVLLTVEGDRVYRSFTVPIRQHSTVVEVPVEAAWGPNVTLDACYVRDKKFAESSAPLRVRLDSRAVNVTVSADRDRYRPGDKATYRIHTTDARSGRPVPCEVSLSVVDESIYALRADSPNALRDAFYPHRSNRVQTLYSFSVEYLGDTDKSEPTIEMRRKFLDTAAWHPSVETGRDGNATVGVALPDNLTTWRATVQAVSMETSVGRAVGKVLVTKPFFLRLDTPRFLTQTDDGRLLTLVHNDTGSAQTAHVRVTAPGILALGAPTEQALQVAPGTDGQLEWPVSARRIGQIPLRAEAWTDGTDAATGKPYTDGIESSIPVRAWGRETFSDITGALSPEDTFRSARSLTIDGAFIPDESRLTIRVTPGIAAALAPALDYLTGYPYGCTEQTMSRVLPDLLVSAAAKSGGMVLLQGPDAAKRTAALPRMVHDGVQRLRRFQHPSGAWGWWEHDDDDPYLTAYVLYGLGTAKSLGYDVPADMLTKGTKAGREQLEKASPNDRPYLMYALALCGDSAAPLARLRALNAGKVKQAGMDLSVLAPDSLAYLVLLARRAGEDYRPAFHQLERKESAQGHLLHWPSDRYRWVCSDQMATALALRAVLAVDRADPRVPDILRYLMLGRTGDYWRDTRDTAVVLTALTDYLAIHPEDARRPTGSVVVRLNGHDEQRIDLAAAAQETGVPVAIAGNHLKAGENTLELAGQGTASSVFFTGRLRQVVAARNGSLPALSSQEGVTITREYLRVAAVATPAGAWRLGTEEVLGQKFKQNDNVRVRLTVTAPRDIDYVLIEDAFPSNCEASERGTEESIVEEGGWSHWYSNVDVRDDRIAFFATHLPKGTHTLEYNLRAQTPGVCRALPAQLQAMYAPSIRAESADSRIEVRP